MRHPSAGATRQYGKLGECSECYFTNHVSHPTPEMRSGWPRIPVANSIWSNRSDSTSRSPRSNEPDSITTTWRRSAFMPIYWRPGAPCRQSGCTPSPPMRTHSTPTSNISPATSCCSDRNHRTVGRGLGRPPHHRDGPHPHAPRPAFPQPRQRREHRDLRGLATARVPRRGLRLR